MTETIAAGRRADARRNIAKILDAAVARLSEDPAASVGSVAEAAGVGRVTLYGHFPKLPDLLKTVRELKRKVEELEKHE